MTQLTSLYCPFEPKVHPEAASIHEGSVRWAQALGLLPTTQHVRSAHKARVGWLVAHAFPAAMVPGLQLAADWTTLFCALDDHLERWTAASKVEAYLQHLLEVFRSDRAGAPEDPFARGMQDLRERLRAMAPASDMMRFADRLAELFAGNVAEYRNRERARTPGLASYLQLREVTIGLHVLFALAELLEGYRLPDHVRAHPALQQLAARASNIVGWANDLFTYEKEIIQGEIHNLVLVLMDERQLTVAAAVAQAAALHDHEVRRFLEEVEHLPSFGEADAAARCHVAMLACWIRGHLDWAHETGRYRPCDELDARPASQTAHRPAAA